MGLLAAARRHPARALAASLVVIAIVAFGLWWFKPWRLVTNDAVNEALPAAPTGDEALQGPPGNVAGDQPPTLIADGRFVGLEHETRGRAVVLEVRNHRRFLRFEDFATSNGPDLVVYLSSKAADPNDWYGYDADFVDLGVLRGNVGDQNYEIPKGVDLGRYSTVVVWCRRFQVGFAAADLR